MSNVRLIVDFTNQPVTALLRGPLLSTPQGLVVIASCVCYSTLALAYGVFGLLPPFGKSTGSVVVICLSWPFIVFLLFIKEGMPSFAPSRGKAAFLAVCAAAPALYVAGHAHI